MIENTLLIGSTRNALGKTSTNLHSLQNSLARPKPGEPTLKQSSSVKFVSRCSLKQKALKAPISKVFSLHVMQSFAKENVDNMEEMDNG